MVERVKGCLNKHCSEYKKRYYKDSYMYCVKCGEKLAFVCKQAKCFKQLPEDCKDKYCAVHLAERSDKRESRNKKIVTVGTGLLAVGVVAIEAVNGFLKNKNS